MGKNNKLINQMKALAARNQVQAIEKASDEMVPAIYAAMALALHRTYGFGYKRINSIFAESQRIWEEHVGNLDDMIRLCEKETGITVMFAERKEEM